MSHAPAYTRGLHELEDGLHAFLQPDGGWGWSNAGLIVGDGASLLIDTLFDLTLTAEMLGAMGPVLAGSPLSGAFNTHGNGDHCYGNQLLPVDLRIYATRARPRRFAPSLQPPRTPCSRRPISVLTSLRGHARRSGRSTGRVSKRVHLPTRFRERPQSMWASARCG
jgi:glyoxylase-like metal-dependent hydrolase (beta-lactamase superfamily II)